MAEFDFTYNVDYEGFETGTLISPSPFIGMGTIDDGNGPTDEFFTVGEAMEQNFGPLGTYIGTVSLNGVEFVVVQSGPDDIRLYGNPPDPNSFVPPATFMESDIMGAPLFSPCFAEGTLIATETGARRVETLQVGDLLRSPEGRFARVKWVGRKSVSLYFGSAQRLAPVRVEIGALGHGLPDRALTVTADHALLLDGVLVEARALLGFPGVGQVPVEELGESYTVYHIETENHEVILAEGQPAETYIDYVARRAFDNYAEYVALYGEEREIAEMVFPRVKTSAQLPASLVRRLRGSAVA